MRTHSSNLLFGVAKPISDTHKWSPERLIAACLINQPIVNRLQIFDLLALWIFVYKTYPSEYLFCLQHSTSAFNSFFSLFLRFIMISVFTSVLERHCVQEWTILLSYNSYCFLNKSLWLPIHLKIKQINWITVLPILLILLTPLVVLRVHVSIMPHVTSRYSFDSENEVLTAQLHIQYWNLNHIVRKKWTWA